METKAFMEFIKTKIRLAGYQITEKENYFDVKTRIGILRFNHEIFSEEANKISPISEMQGGNEKCFLYNSEIYEHAIEGIDDNSSWYRSDTKYTFGDQDGCEIFCEISEASLLFKYSFIFSVYSLERIILSSNMLESNEVVEEIVDGDENKAIINFKFPIFFRFLTAKIYNLDTTTYEEKERKSQELITDCLFELSYQYNINYKFLGYWPSDNLFDETRFRKKSQELNLPNQKYDPNLVKFYQRGNASQDVAIKFLSFYQILEYHFEIITNSILLEKLELQLSDPVFVPRQEILNKIISDIKVFTYRNENEKSKLKNVLENLIGPTLIFDQLPIIEKRMNCSLYSEPRKFFGKDFKVINNEDQVLENITHRIYSVRCALVHSSNKEGDDVSFIPHDSQHERVVYNEIPLIKWLAERIIIKKAKRNHE